MQRLLVFCLLFISVVTSAQTQYSLSDTAQVIALNQACYDLVYNQTALAKSKAKQALKIAQAIPYPFGEAQACSRIGIVYDVEGRYDSAIYFYRQALQLNRRIKNLKGEGAALCNIGLLYLNQNNYQEALSHLHAAIKPLEAVSAFQFLGNCYNNIGLLYQELDNYPKAKYNYLKAVYNYNQVSNVYQKANALGNLANLYSDQDLYDSSILLENQAINIYLEKKDFYNLGKSYNNIAECFNALGNTERAEEAYLLSVKNAEQAQNNIGLAATLVNLGFLYHKTNREAQGKVYIKRAYELSKSLQAPKIKSEIYNRYARILMKEGKYQLASDLLMKSFLLKDSIFKAETVEKIALQEAKFGMERKENENKQLKQTNTIQQLELRNKKTESRNRQLTIYGIVLLSIAVVFSLIFYFNRRNKLQRLKDENRHYEEQNKQRQHISHELHDNVGAQLSYIVSNLALLKNPDADRSRLDAITDMSKQAIVTLRETVWALNNKSIELTSFSDKFKQYISKNLEYNPQLTYTYQETISNDLVLQPIQALNLFRICQEAFSNAVHHAQASHILVDFRLSGSDQLCITIEDNGRGFDEIQSAKTGHYGLQSMRSRAEELGAELFIQSESGKGSRIELNLHV